MFFGELGLMPVFIPLRRLSNRDTSLIDDILNAETQILPADLLRELPAGYLHRQLDKGTCILLLDGLDEVVDENTHRLAAQKINRLVRDYPKSRYIVTCRIAGWQGLLDDFRVLEAVNFSRAEVQRFIFGWHRAVISQDERNQIELKFQEAAEREAAWQRGRAAVQNAIDNSSRRLMNAIDTSPRVMALARNPMLLSLICLVHYVKNILPRQRPILYERCVELLLDAWDRTRNITSVSQITATQKEAVLRAIALEFQRTGKGEASRERVEQIVKEQVARLVLQIEPDALLAQIELRSGILVERSIDVLGFSHLTLQEYLVAKHVQLNPADLSLLVKNFENQEWREVILLYAGLIDDATSIIQSIVERGPASRWLLGGYTLGEAGRCDFKVTQTVLDQLYEDFRNQGQDSETLINVLASVCGDFADVPRTPEQLLSRKLIEVLQSTDPNAVLAARVLGKARVTQAIPALVPLLRSEAGDLRDETAKSVALFGNLALPQLSASVQGATAIPLDVVISVLREIDTAEAAILLTGCYHYFPEKEDQLRVSLALAGMVENDIVLYDLVPIWNDNPPIDLKGAFNNEGVSWPFSDDPRSSFSNLMLKVRDDIVWGLQNSHPLVRGIMGTLGFRAKYPALVYYLAERKEALSRPEWASFGFEIDSDADIALLLRIQKDLKGERAGVRESIGRAIRKEFKEQSRWLRISEWVSEGILTALMVSHFWFCCLIFSDVLNHGKTNAVRLMFVSAGVLWLIYYATAIAISPGRRRRFAALNPVGQVLRRAPYITRSRPWLNFALLQLISPAVMWPVALSMIFASDQAEGEPASLFDWLMLAVPYLLFVVASGWYYYFHALRIDAPALLMLRHPQGRRLLGLPPLSGSKALGPTGGDQAQVQTAAATT
jgi:hypothetical protein